MFSVGLLSSSQIPEYLHMTFPRYRSVIQNSPNVIAIAGFHYDVVVACLFGTLNPETQKAFIHSVFVRPAYRNKEIASILAKEWETELQQRGCKEIATTYEGNNEFSSYLESLLQKHHWEKPQLYEIIYEIGKAKFPELMSAIWVKENFIPSDFTVVEWDKLEPFQLDDVRQEIKNHPGGLSPFIKDKNGNKKIWDAVSIALCKDDKVMGWTLYRWLDKESIVFEILYVYPELQKIGLGIALLGESIRRCYETYGNNKLSRVLANSFFNNSHMINFIDNVLSPYLTNTVKNYRVTKSFEG